MDGWTVGQTEAFSLPSPLPSLHAHARDIVDTEHSWGYKHACATKTKKNSQKHSRVSTSSRDNAGSGQLVDESVSVEREEPVQRVRVLYPGIP